MKSAKASERVLASLTRFVEGRLKLVVNRAKSKAAPTPFDRAGIPPDEVHLATHGGEPHFLNHFEGYFGLSPCRGSRPFSFRYLAGGMLPREACRRMSL